MWPSPSRWQAVAAHAEAPHPFSVSAMMCEFARLTVAAHGRDGLDAAQDHLAQAEALIAVVPADDESFAPWYLRGAVHHRRARLLAEAERAAEALAEAEAAIASCRRAVGTARSRGPRHCGSRP